MVIELKAIISAIFLSVFLSLETVVIKYFIRDKFTNYEQMVFLIEVFKIIVSFIFFSFEFH